MDTIQFVPTTDNHILALQKMSPASFQENLSITQKEEFARLSPSHIEESTPEYYPVSTKKNIDPIFHFYVGSMSVVGLFILFRMIQKS